MRTIKEVATDILSLESPFLVIGDSEGPEDAFEVYSMEGASVECITMMLEELNAQYIEDIEYAPLQYGEGWSLGINDDSTRSVFIETEFTKKWCYRAPEKQLCEEALAQKKI
jgi:hypothetical protein